MKTMPPWSTSAKRFCKVILSSTLDNGKLRIPSQFVTYHGDELDERVTLSVPTGRSWNVRIQRETDRSVWFHDGLVKFMEDNSIGIAFFLIFEFRGDSKFCVLIFDLTATEIQYDCTNDSATSDVDQMQNATDIGEGDDDSIECLGSSAGHLFPHKSAKRSRSASHPNREKCFLREANNIKRGYFTRGKKQKIDEGIAVDGGKSSLKYKEKEERVGRSIPNRQRVDERTTQAKNLSFSTSCKVTLKSYNLKKYFLIVPKEFATLYMPHSTQLIKLVDSHDNEWAVRYISKSRYLASGLTCFLKDKELMEGDECIFKRIRGNQVKLKVIIYRSSKARATRGENKLLPNFFEVTLTPSYVNCGSLNIPSKFTSLLGSQNSRRLVKLVDAADNEWMVRYIHNHENHHLSLGWKRFVQDKKLMVGDVCTFERVWDDEVKMKVTISRHVE